ncbi:MAG: FtsX-like permease family protein, partial [Bdellovibrionota bacterium]
DYRIVVPQELLRQANETQRTFNILMVCIALISLFIGGIGIMNMMLANVAERTHEIGMGRALGATREFVIFQFLAEATVLTLVGGGLGVFLGIVAIGAVSFFVEWRFSVTAFSVILPLVTSALTGLVFGLYPAIKAADMDPVAALRY